MSRQHLGPTAAPATEEPAHVNNPAADLTGYASLIGNAALARTAAGRERGQAPPLKPWIPPPARSDRLARLKQQAGPEIGWRGEARNSVNTGISDKDRGVRRVPLRGLTGTGGLTDKAIVFVPSRIPKAGAPIDVLLHLHGHARGYDDSGRTGARAVDEEVYRMGAQLAAAGVPTVAIMPQGSRLSDFSSGAGKAFDADRFIGEVFKALVATGVWRQDAAPAPGRVTLSGHSGADVGLLELLGSKKPANLGGLFLFDSMYGAHYWNRGWPHIKKRLDAELAHHRKLREATPDATKSQEAMIAFTQGSGFRLRAVYVASGRYRHAAKRLKGLLDGWFKAAEAVLGPEGSPVHAAMRKNFVIEGISAKGVGHWDVLGHADGIRKAIDMLPGAGGPQVPIPDAPDRPARTPHKAPQHKAPQHKAPEKAPARRATSGGLLDWPSVLPVAVRKGRTNISYTRGAHDITVPEVAAAEMSAEQRALVEQIRAHREQLPDYAIRRTTYAGNRAKGIAPMRGMVLGDSGAKEDLTPKELQGAATSKEMRAKQIVWKELAHEGTLDSINTYDNQILTWGRGFSARSGSMNEVLEFMFKADPEAKQELLKAGISCDRDPKNWMVVNRETGMIEQGENALYLLKFDPKLLGVFVTLGRDPKHRQHALDAQWAAMAKRGRAADVPKYAYDWPEAAIALVAHLSHWAPAFGWAHARNGYASTGGDLVEIAGCWTRSAARRPKLGFGSTLPNGAVVAVKDIMKANQRLMGWAGGAGGQAVQSAATIVTGTREDLGADPQLAGHALLPVHGKQHQYYDIGTAGAAGGAAAPAASASPPKRAEPAPTPKAPSATTPKPKPKPATSQAPAPKPPQQTAPRMTDTDDWLTTIYTKAGVATRDEAAALIRAAGPASVQKATTPRSHVRTASDELQPHLKGDTRAHKLDWESVHAAIAPANTDGTGARATGYGSLRQAFLEHRSVQLAAIFGVTNVEEVLAAEEVAEDGRRPDVARKIEDLLFRAHQYAVVETLNVTQSARYKRTRTATYCNIYAHDFVVAQGGYLPRVWWTDDAWKQIASGAEVVTPAELKAMRKRKEPVDDVVAPIYAKTVKEQNANGLNKWFREHGARFGWREETDMTKAQDAVNGGEIGIITAANKSGARSGHISVILAEDKDHQATREQGRVVVPLQSQAGAKNFKYSAESGAPGAKGKRWWADKNHRNGAAYLFSGTNDSPIVTPEEVGLEADEAP